MKRFLSLGLIPLPERTVRQCAPRSVNVTIGGPANPDVVVGVDLAISGRDESAFVIVRRRADGTFDVEEVDLLGWPAKP